MPSEFFDPTPEQKNIVIVPSVISQSSDGRFVEGEEPQPGDPPPLPEFSSHATSFPLDLGNSYANPVAVTGKK